MNAPRTPVRLARAALVPIAPAARGKSTLATKLRNAGLDAMGVISMDAIRGEVCLGRCPDNTPDCPGGIPCQCRNDQVYGIARQRTLVRAETGLTYFLDATNLRARGRKEEVERAHANNLPAIALLATPVSLEELRVRNASRSRSVPDHALVRMYENFNQITVSQLEAEGFDQVILWDDDTEFELMPLSTDARGVSGPFVVIADVHGCYLTLLDLLAKLGFDSEFNHPDGLFPVLVGDLHDRGGLLTAGPFGTGNPLDSGAVNTLRLAMKMVDNGRMLVVDSNHGNKLVRKTLRPEAVKSSSALTETLADIDAQPDAETLKKKIVSFLKRVPVSLRFSGGPTGEFLVAHGAMVKGYEDRNDRKAAGVCNYLREFQWTGSETVIVGHQVFPEPVRQQAQLLDGTLAGEVLRIDTGAYQGGGLTAYLPSEDRFVTVPTNPLDLPSSERAQQYEHFSK